MTAIANGTHYVHQFASAALAEPHTVCYMLCDSRARCAIHIAYNIRYTQRTKCEHENDDEYTLINSINRKCIKLLFTFVVHFGRPKHIIHK